MSSVRKLFSGNEIFCIPVFQRSYSWRADEAVQLLDDINTRIQENSDRGRRDGSYFLGAIILMEREGGIPSARGRVGSNLKRVDVIDGQQRLITLTLILANLRDLANAAGDTALRDSIDGFLSVSGDPSGTTSSVGRLLPQSEEQEFYWFFAQEPGATDLACERDDLSDSLQRFIDNRDALRRALMEMSGEQRRMLADYIVDNCPIIVVRTDDIENAYDIYLKLNFRGVPLTRSNIIKASVLGELDHEAEMELDSTWSRCETMLGDRRFDELFSYLRVIHGRHRSRIVTANLEIERDVGGARRYVDKVLLPGASSLLRIRDAGAASASEDPEIRRSLVYLGWLGHSDWVPPSMYWFEHSASDVEETRTFFSMLDRLAYGLLILGYGRDKREGRFRSILEALQSGAALSEISQLNLTRTEQKSILKFVTNDLYARNKQTCRVVLTRIDDWISGGLTLRPPQGYTVEHVLPRNVGPDGPWVELFPDTDQRLQAVRQLGNMALVTRAHNTKARNASFDTKKSIFFASGKPHLYAITEQLRQIETWSQQVIDTRDDWFLELIKEHWRLSGPVGRELDHEAAGEPF